MNVVRKWCTLYISPERSDVSKILLFGWLGGTTGSASESNDRKVVGSRPTKVVCITVKTGNRMGWTVRCGRSPLLPSCRKLEFKLSALMDSDLAWVIVKSGRQSWRYANAFQRSIISEAIYHLFLCTSILFDDWSDTFAVSISFTVQCQSIERVVTDGNNSIRSVHELVRFQFEFDSQFDCIVTV